MGTQPEVRQPSLWRQLLRHTRLLVALIVVGGVVGAVLALRTPATYEAARVIVSSDPEASPDTFGRLTETVATTDTVLEPVISRLGLSLSTQELLESGMLRVEPVANAAAIRMIARSTDPRLAFDLATRSAQSFVTVARSRGLGTFEVFGNDVLPTDADRPSVVAAMLLGMATGGLILFLGVLITSFFRDPVVFERDAGSEVGAAESFAIRMSTRSAPLRRDRSWEVRPVGVLPAVWRALERAAGSTDGGMLLTCLLVERRRAGDPWMVPLVDQLVGVAREIGHRSVRRIVVYRWPAPDDEDDLLASLERSDAVLLLASEGARRAHLHDLLEVLPGHPGRVLALVASKGFVPALPGGRKRATRTVMAPAALGPGRTHEEERRPPIEARAHRPAEDPEDRVRGNGLGPPPASGDPARVTPAASPRPAQLNDPSSDIRLEALVAVGVDPDPGVIDIVVDRLSDPDPRVREESVAALGRMQSDRAAASLVDAAWSDDPVVRQRARTEIVRSGSAAAARRLIEHLDSRERFLQAASLLTEMGAPGRAELSAALPSATGVKHRAIKALLDSLQGGNASPRD